MEELLEVLNAINPLSAALRERVIGVLHYQTIQKRDILLKAGHVCRQMGRFSNPQQRQALLVGGDYI